jgi:hypothetical protein
VGGWEGLESHQEIRISEFRVFEEEELW